MRNRHKQKSSRRTRTEVRHNALGWRVVQRGEVWDYVPPVGVRDHVSRAAPVVLVVLVSGLLLSVAGLPTHVWGIALYVLALAAACWFAWILTPIAIRLRTDSGWIGTGDFRLRSSGRKVAIGVAQDGPRHFTVFVSFPRRGRMVTAWRCTDRHEAIQVASEMRVLVGQSALVAPEGADSPTGGGGAAHVDAGEGAVHHLTTHARGHLRRPID